jgi:outer membrane protein assembly factor BamB
MALAAGITVHGQQGRAAATLRPETTPADYTQWRGRSRDGAAGTFTPPAAWPDALTRRWSVEVGEGYATPLLVGDVVYVFSRRGETELLTALRAATGEQVWQTSYAAPYKPDNAAERHGPGPKATPVFHGGRIVTLGASGIVSAFDARTGTRLWQLPAPAEHPLFNAASSPAAEGDIVVLHPGNYGPLTAFEAETGKVKWADKEPGAFSPPTFVTLDGVRQVVAVTPGKVIAVNAADGARLWEYAWGTRLTTTAMSPLVNGDTLIVTGQGMGVHALKPVRRNGAWTVDVVWKADRVSVNYSTPVLIGDTIYGMSERNSGQFFALDAATGDVLWLGTPREATNSAAVHANGTLFFLKNTSELVVARPNRTAFEPVKRYTVADTQTWAQPVLSNNRIFIKDINSIALWTY